MSQEGDESPPPHPPEGRAGAPARIAFEWTAQDIRIPPRSRYRRRADGGMDETYRINFAEALTAAEIRRITELLLSIVEEGAPFGITALTKVKFVEPDTLEYRYWCAEFHSDRPNVMFGLWYRLNQFKRIANIDGIDCSGLIGGQMKE